MTHTVRPYVVASIAIAAAGLLAVPTVAPPRPNVQVRAVRLMDDIAYIIGGSGTPIPSPSYVDTDFNL
jgi:hypothetical protein